QHEGCNIADDDTEQADERAYRKTVGERVAVKLALGQQSIVVKSPDTALLEAGDEDHRQRIDDEHENRDKDDSDQREKNGISRQDAELRSCVRQHGFNSL